MKVAGRNLRYLLTVVLHAEARPMTVAELIGAVEGLGLEVDGRPSKAVSDALRWEVGKGRVVKLGRSVYGRGRMPRSTAAFIRRHLREHVLG